MPTWRSFVVSGASASPRSMPPYLPTLFVGVTTSGAGGKRCATGGSLACLTSAASIGASLNFVGFAAARRSWGAEGGRGWAGGGGAPAGRGGGLVDGARR